MKESLDNFPAQEELENQTIKANNSIKIKNLTRTHQLMHFKVRNKFLQCHSKKIESQSIYGAGLHHTVYF